MDRREFDEITRFLSAVGQPSLLTYYGIQESSSISEVDAVVKKRRAWAQGQQSNPKFKLEAMFLIKQNALIRKALLEEPEEYRAFLGSGDVLRSVEALQAFIKAAVRDGTLPPQAEASIRKQGRDLDLPDALITHQIERALAAMGAQRASDVEPTPAPSVQDFYAVLEVDPAASTEQLEQAYRARYRWARNLTDLMHSAEVLGQLDRAWAVLRDPERRSRYDARRGQWPTAPSAEATADVPTPAPPAATPPLPAAPPSPFPAPIPAAPVASPPPLTMPAPPAPVDSPPARLVSDDLDSTGTRLPVPPPPMPTLGPVVPPGRGPAPRARAPRLTIDGPETIVLKATEPRIRHRLLVRNTGDAPMPGRIVVDHDWVEVTRTQLEPKAVTQVVEVTIHADRMPWRAGKTALTVVGDHGERKSITFEVARAGSGRWVPIAAALTVGALVAAGVAYRMAQPAESVMELTITPAAEHVFVNGTEIGHGPHVTFTTTDVDAPLHVRIESTGYASHDELVQLDVGGTIARTIRLEGVVPADPDQALVAEHTNELARCFGAPAAADARLHVAIGAGGKLTRIDVVEPPGVADSVARCMEGVFSGVVFPQPERAAREFDMTVAFRGTSGP